MTNDAALPAAIVVSAATLATGLALAAYFVGKGLMERKRDEKKVVNAPSLQDEWAEKDRQMRGRANSEAQFAQVPHKAYTVAPSMEDIVHDRERQSQKLAKLTPQEVLTMLQEGNARFWMGVAERPETGEGIT